MTLEELKSCLGYTVQVTLDGKETFADIESRFSPDGSLSLSCPPPLNGPWEKICLLPITEDIAAKMSPNGSGNLFSSIRLTRDGEKIIYA